jgi:8-oxo-dGTP diphosphatase
MLKRVDVTYVLLFDESGEQILVVKNKGTESSYFTLPGGAVEQGETLEEAAKREVKEETGLDVELDGIFSVNEAFFEDRGHHAVFFVFRGKIVGGEIQILMPEEIEEIKWMKAEEAEQYVHLRKDVKGLLNNETSAPYILRER